MRVKSSHIIDYLTEHDIKPSMQRIAVMKYLEEHRTHPTADVIYNDLVKKIPTLSKTTVYNTLKLLTEKRAVKLQTIDERNACFDADTTPHAHFLCTRCETVFDIPLQDLHPEGCACVPGGFQVEQSELYLRGCCPECLARSAPDQAEQPCRP